MGDSISPLKLKKVIKKRRISIDNGKCFICKSTSKYLRNPGDVGKKTFIESLIIKIDRRIETTDGYEDIVDFDNKIFFEPIKDDIRWHKNCFSSFTSKTNLKQCSQNNSLPNKTDINCAPSLSCTRSKINVNIDFKKVCFLCEKINHEGCRNLMRVEIPSFWETLEKRCNERNDSYLRMEIGGDFTKLAASEARYHKTCHASYIKQYTYTKKRNDLALYDNAFINFNNEYFNPLIKSRRAVNMRPLLQKYQ